MSELYIICKNCPNKEKYKTTLNDIKQGFECPLCVIKDHKIAEKQLTNIVTYRRGKLDGSRIICSMGHSFNKFINLKHQWCDVCNTIIKNEFISKFSEISAGEYISSTIWRIPYINTSGEENVSSVLTTMGYPFIREMSISEIPGRRYDFYLKINSSDILIENDGKNHFIDNYAKKIDIMKTYIAIKAGYHVIRIDYMFNGNISEFLDNIFKNILNSDTFKLYTTNDEMYNWLNIPSDNEINNFIENEIGKTKKLTETVDNIEKCVIS